METQSKTKNINGTHSFEETKERVSDATGKIREGVEEIVGETRNIASIGRKAAAETLKEGVHKAEERSQQAMSLMQQTIKQHPVRSIAAAAVLGFLVGGYLSRPRS